MAVFTKEAVAVVKVKADTAQANKGISKTVKVMAGLTVGVLAAKKAFNVLSDAADTYAKRSQLMAAAAGRSFKQVQMATRDLITEQKALEFTAAAMNGAFKLSQEQMNTAAKAMIALRNEGNDMERVFQRVTKAVVEGNGRALLEFGVVAEGSTGKLKTFNNVMEALNTLADKQSATMDVAGDSMIRAGNRYKDAVQSFTDALGRLAIALTPVVEKLARAANIMAVLTSTDTSFESLDQDSRFRHRKQMQALAHKRKLAARSANTRISALQLRGDLAIQTDGFSTNLASGIGDLFGQASGSFGGLIPASFRDGRPSARRVGVGGDRLGGRFTGSVGAAFGGGPTGAFSGSLGGLAGGQSAIDAAGRDDFGRIGRLDVGLGGGELGALGGIGEMEEAMQAIGPAVNVFASAGTQAFSAWIQGSMSAGQAITKFVGGALRGIAAQMFGESLKHGAMAIGALAIGGPGAAKSAALHGKAAAAHAAGAVAAGALAKQFGGKGGGRASGSLPGGAAGSGAGGGGGGGSHREVFVVSSPFDHNPRESERRTRRSMRSASTGTLTV